MAENTQQSTGDRRDRRTTAKQLGLPLMLATLALVLAACDGLSTKVTVYDAGTIFEINDTVEGDGFVVDRDAGTVIGYGTTTNLVTGKKVAVRVKAGPGSGKVVSIVEESPNNGHKWWCTWQSSLLDHVSVDLTDDGAIVTLRDHEFTRACEETVTDTYRYSDQVKIRIVDDPQHG